MPDQNSQACYLASLPEPQRLSILSQLSDKEVSALLFDWTFWARPAQLAPQGDWRTWAVIAGRGFGKTRCGGEWVRSQVEGGKAKRIALVARTAADVRDVVIEGESGLLAISPPWNRPIWEPSKRRLTWPNGAIATTFSADEPESLRGPQHDAAWCDEVGSWKYEDTWDQLQFGLRLGNPQCVITTTPRPTALLRAILKDESTVITRGSTYENRANLAPAFFTQIIKRYEGSRLGRQELLAELLEDTPGALWQRTLLDSLRLKTSPPMKRIVVAIDPAVTSSEDSDETGIIVCGRGVDDHLYVLADLSMRDSSDAWARRAVEAYKGWHADKIIGEVNNGGDLIGKVLRIVDPDIPFLAVHASKGKYTRAEPISTLYEQGRAHHVGSFGVLEDEMCTFVPGSPSPNHMDAMVWGGTNLMLGMQPFKPEVTRPR